MDPSEFTTTTTGNLVPIEGGFAFLPARLPILPEPSYRILIANGEAERALGSLRGRAASLANDLLIQRPLVTREAVKSAQIEGTYTLFSDVLRQAAAGPPPDRRRALDNLEVIQYIAAVNRGIEMIEDGHAVGPFYVRTLHQGLLEGTRGADKRPGAYRAREVGIGSEGDDPTTARFVPPPHVHVQPLMDNLFEFIQDPGDLPPLIVSAIAHYQFETIHPFEDGNGRMGRLLIPLTLISMGVLARPILYLSDYLDRHREEYFDNLKAVSCEGSWNQWIEFFLRAVRETAMDAEERIKRIVSLHELYRRRVVGASRSQAPLATIDLIMDQPIVSASDVERFAKCTNPTARSALRTLTDLGIMQRLPGAYPQLWIAQELVDVAYER